jgi:hypothetical protein
MIDKFYLVLGFWIALIIALPFAYTTVCDFLEDLKELYSGDGGKE